jgi:hypothetical protein
MGNVIQTTEAGNLVWYDGSYPHRWLDALGPNVVKLVEDFQTFPIQAANQPAWGLATLVGATTLAPVSGALGGEGIITTAGADNDGANIQLYGEMFSFASAYKTYFGIRYKLSEATQSDFLAGLCITDTDLLGGMTDGIYFRKVDGSTSVSFVLEKDSVEESVIVDTQAANTYAWLEFVYDGTYVSAYVDGAKVAQLAAASNASFPNDEYLTPSLHFLTGDNAVITCTIDKVVAIQIQA